MIDKNKIVNNMISEITLDKISIRQIYDESMKYVFCDDIPDYIYEDKIYRHMVNHIRHNYTNYDKYLNKIRRINDNDQRQYIMFKNAVLNIIAYEYPLLKDECYNQKQHILMAKSVG